MSRTYYGQEGGSRSSVTTGTVCIYGRTKIGKTSDALYTFRDAIVLVTERDALAPVTHQFGFTPPHVDLIDPVDPYVEAVQAIQQVITPAVESGNYPAVVLDSATALSASIFRHLDVKFKSDGRKLYPTHDAQLKDILMRLLVLPCWVIVTFHERGPVADDTSYTRGGPKTSGSKRLVEDIGGMFRLVLRAVVENNKRYYLCDSASSQWVQGDAYGVTALKQEMNLRPLVWRLLRPGEPVPEQLLAPKPFRVVSEQEGGALTI